MRKIEIIQYCGIEIVYQDFSNLKNSDEIKAVVDSGIAYIRRQKPKTVVTLSNMDGMYFNNDLLSYFINAVKGNDPYVIASAVFGLNGLISVMYNGFVKITGRDVRSYKTKEEAMDYLHDKVKIRKNDLVSVEK